MKNKVSGGVLGILILVGFLGLVLYAVFFTDPEADGARTAERAYEQCMAEGEKTKQQCLWGE